MSHCDKRRSKMPGLVVAIKDGPWTMLFGAWSLQHSLSVGGTAVGAKGTADAKRSRPQVAMIPPLRPLRSALRAPCRIAVVGRHRRLSLGHSPATPSFVAISHFSTQSAPSG